VYSNFVDLVNKFVESLTVDTMAQKKSQNQGRASSWTTEEQKAWLESCKPAHTAARGKGSNALSEFWAQTYDGWLARWPLEDPTEDEKHKGIDAEAKMAKFKKVSHRYHQTGIVGLTANNSALRSGTTTMPEEPHRVHQNAERSSTSVGRPRGNYRRGKRIRGCTIWLS
jgi:hypothetical protein